MTTARIHVAVAGLFGAAGVGLWAWGVHAGHDSASIAAQMLLIHAVALVALTAVRANGLIPMRAAIWLTSVLVVGVALFAGDLALRAIVGQRLFPMASPLGGILMMLSWLGLGFAGLAQKKR